MSSGDPKRALRSRSRRSRGGYTLVEIMVAIGILMVGSAGIFAIQQGAIMANSEARRASTAGYVAANVIERIRRDALQWRSGGAAMTGTALDSTSYLVNAGTIPGGPPTAWMNLTPTALGESWGFDYWGRDTTVAADMAYCAQMRFQWVIAAQAIRADVRVAYPRRGEDSGSSAWVGCPDVNTASSTLLPTLRFVHTSTVVRWTPGPMP